MIAKTKTWNRTDFFGVQISTKSKNRHPFMLWAIRCSAEEKKNESNQIEKCVQHPTFIIRCPSHSSENAARCAFAAFDILNNCMSRKKRMKRIKNKHPNKANCDRLYVFCTAFVCLSHGTYLRTLTETSLMLFHGKFHFCNAQRQMTSMFRHLFFGLRAEKSASLKLLRREKKVASNQFIWIQLGDDNMRRAFGNQFSKADTQTRASILNWKRVTRKKGTGYHSLFIEYFSIVL